MCAHAYVKHLLLLQKRTPVQPIAYQDFPQIGPVKNFIEVGRKTVLLRRDFLPEGLHKRT
jgi:hypothetical protein